MDLPRLRALASAGARCISSRSKKTILLLPKMSDLEASTTNSGGRKARPYDRQANPFGRGGVYPRPQRTDRSARARIIHESAAPTVDMAVIPANSWQANGDSMVLLQLNFFVMH